MARKPKPKLLLANNCRALSKDELSFMNAKYEFWINGDNVCVRCTNRARITYHPKNEKFSINIKRVRKITYNVVAIEMFERFQVDDARKKYSLTDIQNALNILRITYQPIDEEHVLALLSK